MSNPYLSQANKGDFRRFRKCRYCSAKVPNPSYGMPLCQKHRRLISQARSKPKPSKHKRPVNPYQSFYDSDTWKSMRRRLLSEQPLCVSCVLTDKFIPATELDHIIPLRIDFNKRLEYSNIQGLCSSCHLRKTQRERTGEYIDFIRKRIIT